MINYLKRLFYKSSTEKVNRGMCEVTIILKSGEKYVRKVKGKYITKDFLFKAVDVANSCVKFGWNHNNLFEIEEGKFVQHSNIEIITIGEEQECYD